LSAKHLFRSIYLQYLSKPAQDRVVYREIRRRKVQNILEIGLGTGQRAQRMLEAARLASPRAELHYTGIDPFEARGASDGPGITLKLAHRLLKSPGARVRLLPGDLVPAIARAANSIVGIDLMVISSRHQQEALAQAWFYLPRVLQPGSVVLAEKALPGGGLAVESVSLAEIERLAAAAARKRAA